MTDGILNLDTLLIQEAYTESDTSAHVMISDETQIKETWEEITREEYEAKRPVIPEPEQQPSEGERLAKENAVLRTQMIQVETDTLAAMEGLASVFEDLLSLRADVKFLKATGCS